MKSSVKPSVLLNGQASFFLPVHGLNFPGTGGGQAFYWSAGQLAYQIIPELHTDKNKLRISRMPMMSCEYDGLKKGPELPIELQDASLNRGPHRKSRCNERSFQCSHPPGTCAHRPDHFPEPRKTGCTSRGREEGELFGTSCN